MERQIGTSYDQLLSTTFDLGFFDDMEEADSAVKMVLGIAASRLDEAPARVLTERLPEPLTYRKLRSHQATPTDISAAQYLHDIAREFGLSEQEAHEVILSVWSQVADAIGDQAMYQVTHSFPPDWHSLLEAARRSQRP